MTVLFDTNIALDVLLDRKPFSLTAVKLFACVENHVLTGYLCGTTLTTIFYLAQKAIGAVRAKEEIQKLLQLFQIAPVNRTVLDAAIQSHFKDFEDAVLYESGRQAGVQAIVTRNEQDFENVELTIYPPEDLLNALRD